MSLHKKASYPLFFLFFLLFFWMNIPKVLSEKFRSLAVSTFHDSKKGKADELTLLQMENIHLRNQIELASEWLAFDQRIQDQIKLANVQGKKEIPKGWVEYLKQVLVKEILSTPAQVIYRDPSFWSSTLWINVGELDNKRAHQTVVAKNSPVLSEGALVGVVDYVGEKQARVRLITDTALTPSVRVARGTSQNRELARRVKALSTLLENRSDLFQSIEEKSTYTNLLSQLKKKAEESWEDGYLAKGEVHGSSSCFWRARSPMLKGVGFNYEFSDTEGASRALNDPVEILKEGDLLVTSGLDGVFPKGLPVGIVTHVFPVKRGGYCYDIDVQPIASNLNDLKTLFILPPLEEPLE